MKKIVSLIIAILMFATLTASATTVEFIIGDTTMAKVQNNVSDRQLTTSQLLAAPFIANDRTMVPVRAVSESFNCQVSWNPDLRQVKIVNKTKEILLYIDSVKASVNGTEVILDTAPVIVGDITFVPVRFVIENMGYNVAFIPGLNSVMIYDQPDKLNIYGESIMFPVADVMNYNISLSYGTHPEEAEEDGFRNYSEFLLNLYDYYGNYMANNSLELTEEFFITRADLDAAYPANLLKGEVSLLYGMLGTESITKAHLAEDNAAEIDAYYKKEYTRAKHILILSENRTDEEAAALAQEVYDALAAGADFDELLAKYNEDPGMTQNPNGYVFTKGEMVKEFEDASFALKPGAVSAPVKSVYGYHIIQGVELPEITEEIKAQCVDALYINPVIEQIRSALNAQ